MTTTGPRVQRSVAFTWGSTAPERQDSYPCDSLLPDCDHVVHRGIDVHAPAPVVFRRFCQLKVAPYSYDWIDNFGRASPDALTPGAERLTLHEPVMTIFELADYQPDRHITLRMRHPRGLRIFGDIALTYRVTPHANERSRIAVRMRLRYPRTAAGRFMRCALPWGDLVMMRKQLQTLKKCSEADFEPLGSNGKTSEVDMDDPTHSAWRWIADILLAMSIVPLLFIGGHCLMLGYRIFHPPRKQARGELKTALAYERVQMRSTDGVSLSALLTVPERPRACVVICHEWGAHKASKLKYAEMVHEKDCAALLFDLRNHGESDNDTAWGDMSRRYTDDLAAAIATVRGDERIGRLPLIVLAFSFSTYPAVHCMAHRVGETADGLILDSGPAFDERDTTHRFLVHFSSVLFPRWMQGPLLFPFALLVIEWLVNRFLHVDWPPTSEQLKKPMLVICGAADQVVPESQVRTFTEHAANAELRVVECCPHLFAFKQDCEKYRDWVSGFIERVAVAAL